MDDLDTQPCDLQWEVPKIDWDAMQLGLVSWCQCMANCSSIAPPRVKEARESDPPPPPPSDEEEESEEPTEDDDDDNDGEACVSLLTGSLGA